MNNKLTLIALFALFFAPILAAVMLHSEWIQWRAAPDRAHGQLIEPVVPLGRFALPDAGGRTRTEHDLAGRWQLAYVTRGECSADCIETLTLMDNIRRAQDRHQSRVGLLVLSGAQLRPAVLDHIAGLGPAWLAFDGRAGRRLVDRLPGADESAFYIIDPEANIMERFDRQENLNGIRKDLDRLLTWTVRE